MESKAVTIAAAAAKDEEVDVHVETAAEKEAREKRQAEARAAYETDKANALQQFQSQAGHLAALLKMVVAR